MINKWRTGQFVKVDILDIVSTVIDVYIKWIDAHQYKVYTIYAFLARG